jgi:uncharacterized protein with GYD domain
MATFVVQGRFTAEAIRGLLAKPEDRSKAIAKLVAAAGGKLKDYYFTTGEFDFMIVFEAPDGEDAVVGTLAAAASGSVSEIRTIRAWTAKEFMKVAERAGSLAGVYKAPGS